MPSLITAAWPAWGPANLPASDEFAVNDLAGAIVKLGIRVPATARTADTLGTEREGTGVLIDDAGFGVADTFGGEIHTPTLTKLANEGLRYNRFHTTSICSPTRASLLTGRNHTRVGSGTIASRTSSSKSASS